jgi:hypothetical protein
MQIIMKNIMSYLINPDNDDGTAPRLEFHSAIQSLPFVEPLRGWDIIDRIHNIDGTAPRLEFHSAIEYLPFVEPLRGWISSIDYLASVELLRGSNEGKLTKFRYPGGIAPILEQMMGDARTPEGFHQFHKYFQSSKKGNYLNKYFF